MDMGVPVLIWCPSCCILLAAVSVLCRILKDFLLYESSRPVISGMAFVTHAPEINGGIVTSWLPVTSAWPSIEECATAIYSQLNVGEVAIPYGPFYGSFINRSLECYPKAVSIWWNQGETSALRTIQSLGPFEWNGITQQ
jgi:hypothetical protein